MLPITHLYLINHQHTREKKPEGKRAPLYLLKRETDAERYSRYAESDLVGSVNTCFRPVIAVSANFTKYPPRKNAWTATS